MPQFSNRPPDGPTGPSLPLLRTPIAKVLAGVVTCADLIGCPTHFYGGRTTPCEPPNCKACLDSVPWRWHGYLTAISIVSSTHFIFEFTAQASDAFVAYRTRFGTLRGCFFKARRAKPSANARVLIDTSPADLTKINLPLPPDLVKALTMIWSIPGKNVTTGRRLDGKPRLDILTPAPTDPAQNNQFHRP